ncbi:MAG TPA: ABATE domain-containing protein [Acidobacteriaceae bacterium]|jgi:predicted RNA-binding Zn ribbon-like protein|nr:ABATE domain-containing protein [Acidobacteriaceae bacterium]
MPRATSQTPEEWIDGFLFVANRPVLDFLNTRPVLANGPTELLPDVHALERWLIASGMVTSPKTKALLRSWRPAKAAAAFLEDLIAFRERLREAVVRIESGGSPPDEFLKEVNALLLEHPLHAMLRKREGRVQREIVFAPRRPADFWAPIVEATADLLSETDRSRLRKCESCVVHFFDTSKKGSRRWCSMNLCGNRVKVAAYQRRQRARS